jgi:hypothetical protein
MSGLGVSKGELDARSNQLARKGETWRQNGRSTSENGRFSEAAVTVLRHNSAGEKLAERLTKMYGKGEGLAITAHKLTRAIYCMVDLLDA